MFYDVYVDLCNKAGKSPSAVAEELGLKRSAVTRWKQGGGITDATLGRIAAYFGVSKQYLLGTENKQETPTIPHAQFREVLSEGGIRLLLDEDANVPDENIKDIIKYIRLRQGQVGR